MESRTEKQPLTSKRIVLTFLAISCVLTSAAVLIEWRSQLLYFEYSTFVSDANDDISVSMGADAAENHTTSVLMWTKFFGVDMDAGSMSHCGFENCHVSNDRNLVNESEFVVFHVRDINWNELPSWRSQNQTYVFFNWESPHHTDDLSSDSKKYFFNWTMTYRNDSDVYAPYGGVIQRRTPLRYDLEYLARTNKSKPIAWLVSNCHTPSKREELVEKLRKFIPVDIYGGCGVQKCERDTDQNFHMTNSCGHIFETEYKFYLAFENSLCTDYVTEKFYRRIQRYIVPIVLERRNYEHLCPEYKKPWFIAADDFKNVQDLTQYLQYLHTNSTAYYEYLSWHEMYETVVHVNSDTRFVSKYHWCELCRVASTRRRNKGRDVVRNVEEWWHKDACHTSVKW